jgi:hypothetical protein
MTTESMSATGKRVLAFAAVLGLGVIAAPLAQAQTFSVIHNFTGGSDGVNPLSGFLFAGGISTAPPVPGEALEAEWCFG